MSEAHHLTAAERKELAKRLAVIPAGRCACGAKVPPGRKWTCRDGCDGTPLEVIADAKEARAGDLYQEDDDV